MDRNKVWDNIKKEIRVSYVTIGNKTLKVINNGKKRGQIRKNRRVRTYEWKQG